VHKYKTKTDNNFFLKSKKNRNIHFSFSGNRNHKSHQRSSPWRWFYGLILKPVYKIVYSVSWQFVLCIIGWSWYNIIFIIHTFYKFNCWVILSSDSTLWPCDLLTYFLRCKQYNAQLLSRKKWMVIHKINTYPQCNITHHYCIIRNDKLFLLVTSNNYNLPQFSFSTFKCVST